MYRTVLRTNGSAIVGRAFEDHAEAMESADALEYQLFRNQVHCAVSVMHETNLRATILTGVDKYILPEFWEE